MTAPQAGQKGFYADRPWDRLWPKRVPKTFAVPNVSCAEVFRESARLYPEKQPSSTLTQSLPTLSWTP